MATHSITTKDVHHKAGLETAEHNLRKAETALRVADQALRDLKHVEPGLAGKIKKATKRVRKLRRMSKERLHRVDTKMYGGK